MLCVVDQAVYNRLRISSLLDAVLGAVRQRMGDGGYQEISISQYNDHAVQDSFMRAGEFTSVSVTPQDCLGPQDIYMNPSTITTK